MNRRTLLALPLLAVAPALARAQSLVLTPRDRADLARIEAYLNGLRTLKARFIQVAPDGAVSQGIAWMERPGRMRFQYDPPTPLLLVAGHGLFVFYDRQLNQTSNIPLGSTPLGILLGDDLRFSGDITVTRIDRLPGQIQVTLLRTAAASEGTLTLVFNDQPLTLVQWIVVDAQRRQTRVSLLNVQVGGEFDQKMFTFIDPKFLPNGNKDYQ